MAKAELIHHRKFVRLKRLLKAPTPHVLGYLEMLWSHGYQTGNPNLGDALDVETAVEYVGEPKAFTDAAVEAGFLEENDDGTYSIHDLYDHAPDYVQKRMVRRGTAPKGVRPAMNGEKRRKAADREERREKRVKEKPHPPTPAPEAGEKSAPKTSAEPAKAKKVAAETDPRFVKFWAVYPRKVGKPKAAAAFAGIDPSPDKLGEMLTALGRQTISPGWLKDAGQFIPHPTTWLNRRGWEDEPPHARDPPPAPRTIYFSEFADKLIPTGTDGTHG